MLRVDLRQRALDDIDAALRHYRQEGGADLGLRFVDDVEAAVTHLRRHPLTGSLRWSYELDIPELRSWPLDTFPYLVFFTVHEDRLDVWRVLHMRRDVRTALEPPDDPMG